MHLDRRELAAIFAGGFVGAVARAELATAMPTHPGDWPWATFIVNMERMFLVGYFTTRLQERLPLSPYRRMATSTGFCGGLTTLASLQVELVHMLDAWISPIAARWIV